jgi:hypothetical protein
MRWVLDGKLYLRRFGPGVVEKRRPALSPFQASPKSANTTNAAASPSKDPSIYLLERGQELPV